MHGFPLDHSMWQHQLSHFSGRYRMIAPDLRGFGGSRAINDATLGMELHADDLAQLLDALRLSEPIVLCGLSMGGYVAWQFERRHAGRLTGMVLCDTKAKTDSETMRQARHALAERVMSEGPRDVSNEMLQKLFARATLETRPSYLQQTFDVMTGSRKETVAAALRGMAERADATTWLEDVQVPCCVICGEHDVISPPQEMRLISDQLRQADYIEIPDAGHMSPLENPMRVNSAIGAFVDGLTD